MQDVTDGIVKNTTEGATATLKDKRDEKEYTVTKQADGNLWMTQNLALGGSTAMNLTQADSNVGPSGFTLPASATEYDWIMSFDDPVFFDYAGNYPSQQTSNKYGNYYNYPAATAGVNPSSGDSQYDICPKNWRLPSAGINSTTDNEFYTMLNNYITTGTWNNNYWSGVTTSEIINTPVSLVFSGVFYDGAVDQGNRGYWWSSTANDYYSASDLYTINNGDVNPGPNQAFNKTLLFHLYFACPLGST